MAAAAHNKAAMPLPMTMPERLRVRNVSNDLSTGSGSGSCSPARPGMEGEDKVSNLQLSQSSGSGTGLSGLVLIYRCSRTSISLLGANGFTTIDSSTDSDIVLISGCERCRIKGVYRHEIDYLDYAVSQLHGES
jgi:hypothetical protein